MTGWRELALADLSRMADRGRTRENTTTLLLRAVVHRRFRAVAYFRLSQHLHVRGATRPVGAWLAGRILGLCGAELAPGSVIGPGLGLVHTTGLVVGHAVVAGRDLTLHQNVTLGAARGDDGQPRIGDGVIIGAGAKVLGPVHVGDGAVVAANAVVLHDVPAAAIVAGAPARVVGEPADGSGRPSPAPRV